MQRRSLRDEGWNSWKANRSKAGRRDATRGRDVGRYRRMVYLKYWYTDARRR